MQIDVILDDDKYMSIINSSNWPTTRVINCTTKYELLQHVIENEVFHKRRIAMSCVARGLDRFGLKALIKHNMKQLVDHIVTARESLRAETLLSIMKCETDGEERHERALDFFKTYLHAREGESGKVISRAHPMINSS